MSKLEDIKVLGVHPVEATDELFWQTLEIQWGSDLSGDELKRAEQSVREHFANLYLIEVQISPPDAKADWGEITQEITDCPSSNWQVPWDERPIDEASGKWAFYFHFLNISSPLISPIGPLLLPQPTKTPLHLADCVYDLPG